MTSLEHDASATQGEEAVFKIITPDNRAQNSALIDAMHEMRYRIVVGEWGWDIPGIAKGYDKDQFDTDDTVYVIVRSRAGEVVGSSRHHPPAYDERTLRRLLRSPALSSGQGRLGMFALCHGPFLDGGCR